MIARTLHRYGRAAAAAFGLAAAGAGVAQAQVRHNDYTSMNSQYSTEGAASVSIDSSMPGMSLNSPAGAGGQWNGRVPALNETLGGQMSTLGGNFSAGTSPLSGQMSSSTLWQKVFSQGNPIDNKMFPEPSMREPELGNPLQKDSPLNQSTQYDQYLQFGGGPSKFSDAYVFHTASGNEPMEQIGRELSMQDINRYEFHRSNSSEPGLPVTHAGEGTNEPSISGGNLFSSPALFSSVPSGGAVAPMLITAGGSQPLQPTSENTLKSTPLLGSGAASSQSTQSGMNTPQGFYAQPRDGVNTPVQLSKPQAWVDIHGLVEQTGTQSTQPSN